MKKNIILFLIAIFFNNLAQAVVLEDLVNSLELSSILKDKTIGYYVGSFDPLHKGHEEAAQLPIKLELCDYVLVYPSWRKDSFKNGAALEKRYDMLISVFKDHPNVIITKLNPKEMQNVLTIPDYEHVTKQGLAVKPKIDGLGFVGIVGSDTAISLSTNNEALSGFMRGIEVPEQYEEHSGLMALPADAFIVLMRKGDNLEPLDGKIGDRKIIAVIDNGEHKEVSSTMVKQMIKSKKSINTLVSPYVVQIIKDNNLYQ